MKAKPYMNSYFAGILLGLVLLLTIYVTGRGLGASGGIKSIVIQSVQTVAPDHAENTEYYANFKASHPEGPLRSWLVFEILGVLIGAFISGVISDRVSLKLEKGPQTTNKVRIIAAVLGGMFFGFGAQLARGCTSGAALSGMSVLSFGGIITMMAIFGSAYGVAFFFRKLWIRG